jgi:hypothetical protein
LREDGAPDEPEAALARGGVLFEDVRAGDVARHEIGRELDAAELAGGGLRVRLADRRIDHRRAPEDHEIGAFDPPLHPGREEVVAGGDEPEVDPMALTEGAKLLVYGLGAADDQQTPDTRPVALEGHPSEPAAVFAARADAAVALGVHPQGEGIDRGGDLIADGVHADAPDALRDQASEPVGVRRPEHPQKRHGPVAMGEHCLQDRGLIHDVGDPGA